MIKTISIQVSPKISANLAEVKLFISNKQKVPLFDIGELRIVKRSIDARSKNIKVNLQVMYAYKETKTLDIPEIEYNKQDVSQAPTIHIIGSGPAGMFAALTLIEKGFRPVVIERGKDVSARKRDIADLNRNKDINTNSNYCFGEGGAGTFSDGKLYTRSKKKGNNQKILELFVFHGADPSILIDSHPHIGTDKLPEVMKNMRETIISCGGEVLFNTEVTGFELKDKLISALKLADGTSVEIQKLVLATGHSARGVYYSLHEAGIELEAKPFAMGVRAEHPQALIDNIQYHGARDEFLPAASYSLVQQVEGRGVYSFCMCPGGIIVPAATGTEELVVNGMSNSGRNSKFANSGIAVELQVEDFKQFEEYGPLAGLKFQEYVEGLAHKHGGGNQVAPAQSIGDFIKGKESVSLPECSYIPGVTSSPLHEWLPKHISSRLKEAFIAFDKRIRGYATNKGIIVGVESRTSSPVRIPRDRETYKHITVENLYPCGEGSGYAGGIVSSAIDGMNCITALTEE